MIVDINDKSIFDYSKEELQNWIEYFENYQAQNISANEQTDGVIINGISIDQWKGWMKKCNKASQQTFSESKIKHGVIEVKNIVNNNYKSCKQLYSFAISLNKF